MDARCKRESAMAELAVMHYLGRGSTACVYQDLVCFGTAFWFFGGGFFGA